MAANSKRKPGLALACAFSACHDEGRSVEHRGQGREPGLVVVLRTKVRENRIGHVTLEQFRTPALPVAEQPFQSCEAMNACVTPQKFAGGRWRTRARVEQHDRNFSARKCLIDYR